MADCSVLWTETARRDLDAIVGFIAEDSPAKALGMLDRIEARAGALRELPERGAWFPNCALSMSSFTGNPERESAANAAITPELNKLIA